MGCVPPGRPNPVAGVVTLSFLVWRARCVGGGPSSTPGGSARVMAWRLQATIIFNRFKSAIAYDTLAQEIESPGSPPLPPFTPAPAPHYPARGPTIRA